MENRTFIWGLVLLFMGIFGAAIGLISITHFDTSFSWTSWFCLISGFWSAYNGMTKINKTTL